MAILLLNVVSRSEHYEECAISVCIYIFCYLALFEMLPNKISPSNTAVLGNYVCIILKAGVLDNDSVVHRYSYVLLLQCGTQVQLRTATAVWYTGTATYCYCSVVHRYSYVLLLQCGTQVQLPTATAVWYTGTATYCYWSMVHRYSYVLLLECGTQVQLCTATAVEYRYSCVLLLQCGTGTATYCYCSVAHRYSHVLLLQCGTSTAMYCRTWGYTKSGLGKT